MKCIEKGCQNEAGTPWTPLWCLPHDEERRARISASLQEIQDELQRVTVLRGEEPDAH